MKRWLLCLAAVFLSSCIEVDDLDGYWSKGTLDLRLAGKWFDTTANDQPRPLYFTREDTMYRIDTPHGSVWLRTLRIANYSFIMTGPDDTTGAQHAFNFFGPFPGHLSRYKIEDGKFFLCGFPNRELMQSFLREKAPKDSNIKFQVITAEAPDYIKISKLDDRALKFISEIPDDDDYWQCQPVMSRISH